MTAGYFAPRIVYPPTISEVQSYGFIIRDMLLAKLVTAPFYQGFSVRRSRQLPTQINQLPMLGVYLVKEDLSPDGDPNAGDIEMVHNLTIGFSVVIINSDPEATQKKLNQAYWVIMNWLWRDQYLMNLLDTRAYPGGIGNPDNVRIEGLLNGSWRFVDHPPLNNETPMSELRYEQTLKYRADYTPIITDDLLLIHQETAMLDEVTGEIKPADEVQRVVTEYAFDPPPPEVNPLERKE
jgi:hypothetical protein